jgi:uncharacterized FAD-dependent dehydrogenase
MKYDVIIVGAGAAGLFSALKLAGKLKVAIFEMGREIEKRICPSNSAQSYCQKCSPCNIVSGVGGAGGFSDGKLNFINPEYSSSFTVGGDFDFIDKDYLMEKMEEVDKIFLEYGASEKIYGSDKEKIENLVRKANKVGIDFVPLKQRHLGSDKIPKIIKGIVSHLRKKRVEIFTEETVLDINPKKKKIKTKKEKEYQYDFLIIAVGREGAKFLEKWVKEYNFSVNNEEKAIDVGVRVEVPASIMEEITSLIYDPKLRIVTKKHDDHLRTFCTCPNGWVMRENYEDFCLVNGHSKEKEKTNNTNFALLGHYKFTEPFKLPNEWGRDLARLTTKLGDGNPILQRLKDLRLGRRSTEGRISSNKLVQPTLKTAIPGDISLAYPGRLIEDILDALEQLDKFLPGVAQDSTLLYAPEIKFYSLKLKIDEKMRTNIPFVYAIGDGAGISRGIVGAAITGLIAGENIIDVSKI